VAARAVKGDGDSCVCCAPRLLEMPLLLCVCFVAAVAAVAEHGERAGASKLFAGEPLPASVQHSEHLRRAAWRWAALTHVNNAFMLCCCALREAERLPAARVERPAILSLLRTRWKAAVQPALVHVDRAAWQPLGRYLLHPARDYLALDLRPHVRDPRVEVGTCLARIQRADRLPHLRGGHIGQRACLCAAKGHQPGLVHGARPHQPQSIGVLAAGVAWQCERFGLQVHGITQHCGVVCEWVGGELL